MQYAREQLNIEEVIDLAITHSESPRGQQINGVGVF